MPCEKYIVAASENRIQITVRNILNSSGYIFLGHCSDSVLLLRLIRSYRPDFIVVDIGMELRELKVTMETIDDEMLCACVAIGDYKDVEIMSLLEKTKVTSFCSKPINKDILLQTIELANMNYKRIFDLNRKLQEMTRNYEERKFVERAKWILMERDGISENEAYEKIRKKSMNSRLSMKDIAWMIISEFKSIDNRCLKVDN